MNFSWNNTNLHRNGDPFVFDEFAPTLAQCFFIVLAGYLAAKFELLSASDLRGVNMFATYFAMPGIICVSLADADLDELHWELLVGLLIGKCLIFALITTIILLFTEPSNVGVAGLLAVFCVQSNDLPVGNPLISALYRDVRPHMMKYLFFMPALTSIFLVPIGHLMIEAHKSRKWRNSESTEEFNSCQSELNENGKKNKRSTYLFVFNKQKARVIIKDLAKNPVIISTFAGILLNLTFKAKVPGVLHQPINVVAATIPGLALSILGFNMVRKERYIISSAIVFALVLIAAKMILTPLVLHAVVKILSGTKNYAKSLSDFALLYGIISPATVIFQTGKEFRKPLAAMSAALIISSLMCFPLSYTIAKFTIPKLPRFGGYIPLLRKVLLYVSSASITCNILLWISFLWKKELKKAPCSYVAFLAFTQLVTSCGVIMWKVSDVTDEWSLYSQMALYYGGEISGYFMTGTIAMVLVLQRRFHNLAEKGFSVHTLIVFGISALITSLMCLLITFNDVQNVLFFGEPTTTFEHLQLTTTTVLLGLCLIITGICIMLHCKNQNAHPEIPDKTKEQFRKFGYDNNCVYYISVGSTSSNDCKKISNMGTNSKSTDSLFTADEEICFYYQDVLRSGNKCQNLPFGRKWTFRSFSLLVLLWITMALRFISNLFKLAHSQALEIMIPLEFLQGIFFIGQGIFVFFTFGIDIRSVAISTVKWWRKLRYGKEEFQPPSLGKQDEVTIFRDHFFTYFYSHCIGSLAKERLWKNQFYKDSFWGHQMVDWFIENGICKDEIEAEEYGQKLLLGGIIRHVKSAHAFHDAPYLYYFVRRETNVSEL